MRLALCVPATNERGPKFVEQAFAAIHQANPHRLPLSLELCSVEQSVSLACSFPSELRAIIEGQLFAQYPDLKLEATAEPTLPPGHRVWVSELTLTPDVFPLRR